MSWWHALTPLGKIVYIGLCVASVILLVIGFA